MGTHPGQPVWLEVPYPGSAATCLCGVQVPRELEQGHPCPHASQKKYSGLSGAGVGWGTYVTRWSCFSGAGGLQCASPVCVWQLEAQLVHRPHGAIRRSPHGIEKTPFSRCTMIVQFPGRPRGGGASWHGNRQTASACVPRAGPASHTQSSAASRHCVELLGSDLPSSVP